jgi:hypothetical protein
MLAALAAQTAPQLARMHYDGGGDWYNDPDMLPTWRASQTRSWAPPSAPSKPW